MGRTEGFYSGYENGGRRIFNAEAVKKRRGGGILELDGTGFYKR